MGAESGVSTESQLTIDVLEAIVEMGLGCQPVVEAIAGGGVEGEHVGQHPGRETRREVDLKVATVVHQRDVDRLGMIDAAARDQQSQQREEGQSVFHTGLSIKYLASVTQPWRKYCATAHRSPPQSSFVDVLEGHGGPARGLQLRVAHRRVEGRHAPLKRLIDKGTEKFQRAREPRGHLVPDAG